MADRKHLTLLKQGVVDWNSWRAQHPSIHPNLRKAYLIRANLRGADLSGANLGGANLRGADLRGVNLGRADLYSASLSGANLGGAVLSDTTLVDVDLREANLINANLFTADLRGADLGGADLREANLINADLEGADLREANLRGADLTQTYFKRTDLDKTIFTEARVLFTTFADVDLRTVRGLETIKHDGPSTIGIDTLYRSAGQIPESFLRLAGVPEDFLTYLPSLVNRAIEYYTCFISYSSQDQEFVDSLYAHLQAKRVRCWYAPEDMKIGDKIRQRIDETIRLYDKLLLVLSEQSVQSAWVEFEVEAALEKERQGKRTVLFPIRLDEQVMQSHTAWAADIRRSRHIGDFTQWKDHDSYQLGLQRLLRDLHPDKPPGHSMP